MSVDSHSGRAGAGIRPGKGYPKADPFTRTQSIGKVNVPYARPQALSGPPSMGGGALLLVQAELGWTLANETASFLKL